MTGAIVLDGHLQSALAAVRSLGGRGIPVVVGSVDGNAMAAHSRFRTSRFRYPDPEIDVSGFVDAVAAQVHDGAVIYVFSDATTLAISRWRDRVGDAVILLPSNEHVEAAFDKRRTLQLAQTLGIAIPPTLFLESTDDLEAQLGGLTWPVVVKPAHSCTWPTEGAPAETGTAEFCTSPAKLRAAVLDLTRRTGELPLVQGLVRGQECGYFGLFRDGNPLATFAHRRLRSIRITGGASALREAVMPHPLLERGALALMRALHWTGPAMVEFKFDGDTPTLMEINGRYWGSLPLAVAAGVDFPHLHWELATLGRVHPPGDWIVGTRSRNLLGDFRNLVGRLQVGSLRERLVAVRDFTSPDNRTSHHDVFSSEDPWPFLAQFFEKGARFARKGRHP